MKCDSCPAPAIFRQVDAGVDPAAFCRLCLPPSLQMAADAGYLAMPNTGDEISDAVKTLAQRFISGGTLVPGE